MSVTVQTIPQDPSVTTLKNVSEFFVPTILSFNLKKTPEDRLLAVETENISSHQNGDIVTEEHEDVIEMSPRRKESNSKSRKQTSSFLLQPFLKPVAPHMESNKENPVLKALFGGKNPPGLSPWAYVTRTSINNCHPFKKTEFSHDLSTDDTPAQVPKSLQKSSRSRKSPTRRESSPESKPTVLKEIQIEPNVAVTRKSTASLPDNSPPVTSPKTAKTFTEPTILSKRKKIVSQTTLPPAKPRLQYINSDRLIQLRTLVDNAVKNHKIYSMTGCYNSVRNALKQRGWIEKIDSDVKGRRKVNKFEEIGLCFPANSLGTDSLLKFYSLHNYCNTDGDSLIAVKYQTIAAMRLSIQTNSGFAHNDQIHYTGQGEAEIMNRMLKNVTEDLCWLSRPYPYYCLKDFDKFEMINHLPKAYFSNKIGLCNSLQQIQWFYEAGVCSTQFPRTYNTSMKDELEAFKEDFRLTACISLLKWFLQTYKSGGENAVRSPDGKVDMNVIEFSLRRCAEYVKTKQHEDIDISDTPTVWEYQWDQFITQYYKVVNEGQILKDNKEGVAIKAIISNVQSMLNILKPYWPQFDIEGYQNYWIVKPGGRCCGAGIVIKNNLEQILLIVNPNSMKETRFVVQKYIERPLLIYNTKFDIRQWFLVTNVYPLTVWMYKESYLRFCSQPFTLKNTHESIHLCNNAVQRKYKNGKRDRGLPDENMWDCYTFQTYLKAIGHPDAWEKYIYPGMKEGFIGALLASQDSMERRKNCFELYGADFMISDTLTDGPWLIEINSNPAMDSSTSVTARMCPQVLEDIIKVVIDRRDNKSAPTGAFEMVFRQNCPPIPPYLGMSLCIKGKKAYKSSGDSRTISRKSKSKHSSEPSLYTDTEEDSTAEEIFPVENSPNVPGISKRSSSDDGKSEHCQSSVSAKFQNSTEKLNTEGTKKERGNKRRKVDWVRKNIEDLKSLHSLKQSKTSVISASCGSSPKRQMSPNSESVFRDEVLKLLGSMEIKQFLKEILEIKKDLKEDIKKEKRANESEDLMIGGIELIRKKSNESNDDIFNDCEVSDETKKALLRLLQICREKSNGEVIDWNEDFEENESRQSSKCITKSCPNFDSAFESELRKIDEKEKKSVKSRSDESMESFVSATSCISKTSKASLDYFRDWRSKLSETRRTCEDMLAKLQVFQEENSKVKFQNALKKRVKDEVDFINRIRQYRKGLKVSRGRVLNREKQKEGSKRSEVEDGQPTWKAWDSDGDGGLTPLAINSETGAVRSINDNLPKIKKRSRPLLPNGSSGNGRKINVALVQSTFCH